MRQGLGGVVSTSCIRIASSASLEQICLCFRTLDDCASACLVQVTSTLEYIKRNSLVSFRNGLRRFRDVTILLNFGSHLPRTYCKVFQYILQT